MYADFQILHNETGLDRTVYQEQEQTFSNHVHKDYFRAWYIVMNQANK